MNATNPFEGVTEDQMFCADVWGAMMAAKGLYKSVEEILGENYFPGLPGMRREIEELLNGAKARGWDEAKWWCASIHRKSNRCPCCGKPLDSHFVK